MLVLHKISKITFYYILFYINKRSFIYYVIINQEN